MLILILFFCLNNVALTTGKRTQVIWMVPSWHCTGEHSIPVEKYGIIQNENQQYQNGSKFAMFYMEKFGKFPYFEDFIKSINGGLPQNGDISEHLRLAEKDIEEMIPAKDFDGLAVIDLEHFRPNWELSWGKFDIYKKESLKLARKNHPTMSKIEVIDIAREEYNDAAKKYFVETIRLGKRLRPNAKWGYYLFPKCNNNVGQTGDVKCSQKFKLYNENLDWLWKESSALFPSFYLHPNTKDTHESNRLNYAALIIESRRLKKIHCPHCEIHMFTAFEYDAYRNPSDLYSKASLRVTLESTLQLNVDSAVFWSTSKNMKERCDTIAKYVNESLGPHIQYVNNQLDKCRKKTCRGRGECYLENSIKNPQSSDYLCRYDQ